MKKIFKKQVLWFLLILAMFIVAFTTMTYAKSTGFSFWDKWTTESEESIIKVDSSSSGAGPLQQNLLQVLIAFFGGGALAVAGALLQKVTRNRLAEVSILGIGSLNILFIYIYAITLGSKAFGSGLAAYLLPILLIIVSIFGTLLIWAVSRSKKSNKNTFVIIGIAMQLFVEALSVIVVNPRELTSGSNQSGKDIWAKIQGYTLGDIRNGLGNDKSNPVEWWLMIMTMVIVLIIIAVIFFLRRKIDTYETSSELTHSTGIKIGRLRLVIYLLVALLAGVSSATLGTVALLGIIAPSIARLMFKNKMWPITIASFIIGGTMVALAAFVSLQLEWGLPVGILSTAIVIPYFLFLMIRNK